MSTDYGKSIITDKEYYRTEEYLLAQERAFKKQKNPFQDFLPIEFFHWVGMNDAGERGIISLILEDHPEYINIKNKTNETGLMVAARLNLLDNLKVLIENPDVDISYSNENGNFVMYAITYNSHKVINYIFDNHKDKIDFDCKTIINDSLFHLAARNANMRIWEREITQDLFNKYGYEKNHADQNCLDLAIDGYFDNKNILAFDEVFKFFKRSDIYTKNKDGNSIVDRINYKEKELILYKQPTKFLMPLKAILGLETV